MAGKAEDLSRLDSWKQIAAYFGRDQRTVKRWEGRRGLPVYRAPGGGKTNVYAYVAELEAWLRQDVRGEAEVGSADDRASLAGMGGAPAPHWRSHTRHQWLAIAGGALLLMAGLFAIVERPPYESASANPEANRLYRSGLYSWQTRTPAGLRQAMEDFQAAIRADPKFAAAYAGLADCYDLLPEYTDTRPEEAFPKAQAAAERAVRLDDGLAAAHRSLGYVEFWWARNNSAAMHEFRRALELDSHSSQTHHWYANALSAMGEFPEALRQIDAAQELDPGSTALMADKGLLLVDAGSIGRGIHMLRQVEVAQPQFAPAHLYLAFAYRLQRNGQAALNELRWHGELTGDRHELATAAAGREGYAAGGYMEMSRRIVAQEEVSAHRGRVPFYELAVEYQRLGETERALALLTQAVSEHDRAALAIRIEPEFHALYGNRRFATLVAKEGFSLPKRM